MRNLEGKSNYLAKTEKLEYDNLFRRISGLANTWLDHNACILKSNQINLLVKHIEENTYFKSKGSNTASFLSTHEYFLGQFIQSVFKLQDETCNDATKHKLRNVIIKILDAFDNIKVNHPITPQIDLNKLSESTDKNNKSLETDAQAQSKPKGIQSNSVWEKVKGFFN